MLQIKTELLKSRFKYCKITSGNQFTIFNESRFPWVIGIKLKMAHTLPCHIVAPSHLCPGSCPQ